MFLVLFTSFCWSQDSISKVCKGKILSDSYELADIHIINKNSQRGSISTADGSFSIQAKRGDTLLFSAVHLIGLELILEDKIFENELIFVRLEIANNQLDEFVVRTFPHINAVSLGIIPKGQKRYTPAERRYNAATNSYAKIGLNTSFSADPLLNMFSGRSAMLKKALETERKEHLISRIKELFDDAFLSQKLLIPLEYLNGFRFFIVEDSNFVSTIKNENLKLATFLLGELAGKFKHNLNDQK